MRIAINAFPLRPDGGGARYVFADLLDALLDLPRHDAYTIFLRKPAMSIVEPILRKPRAMATAKVVLIHDPGEIALHRDAFDLLFAPIDDPGPPLADKPVVVTIHDLLEFERPEVFPPAERADRQQRHAATARACTTLIAISETCRQSFMRHLAIPPEKIAVVYNAPQSAIVRADDSPASWTRAPLPASFVFYPANTFAHKNHALLLDAIAAVPESAVLFTGYEVLGGFPLRKEIARRQLSSRATFFTDLTPAEMRHVYRSALATVLPTAYEGFGLPAVESLACSGPLICSDLPALREVAGDAATYVPVGDTAAWTAALRGRFTSARAMVPAVVSLRIVTRFNWPASAQILAGVLDETLARFAALPRSTGLPAAPGAPSLAIRLARRLPISWQDRLNHLRLKWKQ